MLKQLEGTSHILTAGIQDDASRTENSSDDQFQRYGNKRNYNEIPYETWQALDETTSVIMTSAAEGVFGVSGLDDGTYYLMEIKAPTGYNLLDASRTWKSATHAATANEPGLGWRFPPAALTALTINRLTEAMPKMAIAETGAVALTVAQQPGRRPAPLRPAASARRLFYVIGGLLVAGAGLLLVVRLRMRAGDEE